MKSKNKIQLAVRFNSLKHHRNCILNVLHGNTPEKIIDMLEPICNNYIDIYTGDLTPEEIGGQVVGILESMNKLSKSDFRKWVGETNGYRQIQLTDGSEWIVRESMESDQYIHLHPSRTGKFSYRFKGSTLKTVLLMKTMDNSEKNVISLENVNRVRLLAGLSPVKKLEKGRGILNCYMKFFVQG